MIREYQFRQVDVFTARAFGGNPLAVFTDADGLSDEEMQAVALEMNLSETTFVLPPENSANTARVRIFTPHAELPFAGHPTIGTAWVLADSRVIGSGQGSATLELGLGPTRVDFEDTSNPSGFIWMHQGDPVFGEVVRDRALVAAALNLAIDDLVENLPIQFVSTGLPFLYVALRSAEIVDRARISGERLSEVSPATHGAFLFYSEPGSDRAYSRMIATIGGSSWEDPATGSASGPLGAYMVKYGLTDNRDQARIISEQGTQMGRQSFVHVRVNAEAGSPTDISVGGTVVPVISGQLQISG